MKVGELQPPSGPRKYVIRAAPPAPLRSNLRKLRISTAQSLDLLARLNDDSDSAERPDGSTSGGAATWRSLPQPHAGGKQAAPENNEGPDKPPQASHNG